MSFQRPLKRIALALLVSAGLAAFSAAIASAQEPGDLFFYKATAGTKDFVQRVAVLYYPAGQAAVDAAVQWIVRHGYLTDADLQSTAPAVSTSGGSTTITFHVVGGPDVVIVLSNGPFLPTAQPNRLMVVNVVRSISNGF